jgi:hypothetical protein
MIGFLHRAYGLAGFAGRGLLLLARLADRNKLSVLKNQYPWPPISKDIRSFAMHYLDERSTMIF